MGRNFGIRVCFSFLLFSTQNQVPQIIIGMSRVIYSIKALSVVILRTTLKSFEFFFSVEKNRFEFLIFGLILS